jgi:hypothetical protein
LILKQKIKDPDPDLKRPVKLDPDLNPDKDPLESVIILSKGYRSSHSSIIKLMKLKASFFLKNEAFN